MPMVADNCVYVWMSETKCLYSQAQAYRLLPTAGTGWLWILITPGTGKWHILNHVVNKRHEAGPLLGDWSNAVLLQTACSNGEKQATKWGEDSGKGKEPRNAPTNTLWCLRLVALGSFTAYSWHDSAQLSQQWEVKTWVNVALESVWMCEIIKKGKSPKLGRY